MTRSEIEKAIMESVINGHYSQDELDLFKAEYGWVDWMNDYTDAEEGEEISETESREIDAILEEGFKMAFDAAWRKIHDL